MRFNAARSSLRNIRAQTGNAPATSRVNVRLSACLRNPHLASALCEPLLDPIAHRLEALGARPALAVGLDQRPGRNAGAGRFILPFRRCARWSAGSVATASRSSTEPGDVRAHRMISSSRSARKAGTPREPPVSRRCLGRCAPVSGTETYAAFGKLSTGTSTTRCGSESAAAARRSISADTEAWKYFSPHWRHTVAGTSSITTRRPIH